jgi:carboxyl-terminal processing protease
MKQNSSATILKVFMVAVTAMIIALAAFGVGVGVGVAIPKAAPLPAPAAEMERAPSASPDEAIVTPSTPRPTLGLTPVPAKSTAVPPAKNSSKSEKPELDTKLFNEALKLLNSQFYGDVPQGKALTYEALRGFVNQLGDPHTAFLDPEQAAQFNSDIQGQFEGIGARVDKAEKGGVEIKYLFAGQPAEKAGVRVGDIIKAVDGKDVTQLDLNEAIALIRGPRDTKVVLTIQRGDQTPFDMPVTRARIEIPVVEAKTLADGKVEYIALSEFSSVASGRLEDALKTALAKKPAGLILDLRGNPGGLLDAAVRIGSYFVPEGNILIERFQDGHEQVHPREGSYLLGDTKLVVLVDGGSASASEIVAGAIQDAGTGKLIGEKSYGKGSVQLPNALSDGSQLRVTIAHWFTPKDRAIHGVGLEPDIVVPLTDDDRQAKRDPQLDRAVEFLTTGE